MAYHPSQIAWKKENTLKVNLEINRNTSPELYELLKNTNGSKAAVLRELISIVLAAKKAQETEVQK